MQSDLLLNHHMILSPAYWVCTRKCSSLPRRRVVLTMKIYSSVRNQNILSNICHAIEDTKISDIATNSLRSCVKRLADFRADILEIKKAITNNSKSGYRCRRPGRFSNCIVTKSKCSHCFVCGSLGHRKSACPKL